MGVRHDLISLICLVVVTGGLGLVGAPPSGAEPVREETDPVIRTLLREDNAAACTAASAEGKERSAAAESFLASCYEAGVGVKKDAAMAARLYRSAMDQGERKAKLRLGMLILRRIIPGAPAEGIGMIRDEAEIGSSEAAFMWSSLLHAGRDVPRDDPESLRWLRRSSDGGNIEATEMMARLYDTGTLVPRDEHLANVWRDKAIAMRPNQPPIPDDPAPILDPPAIKDAERRMGKAGADGDKAEYFRQASILAEYGKSYAQATVASFYESGETVTRDYAEAERWYRKAVAGGSDLAHLRLALMIYRKWIPGDEKEAFGLLHRPAHMGYPEAEYVQGYMLLGGRGVDADPVEAIYWFRRSALKGYAAAQFMLASAYHDGKGVPQDMTQYQHWMEDAARQGSALARSTYCQSVANGEIASTPSRIKEWCGK